MASVNNQGVNYNQENDKFHVMLNQELTTMNNYFAEITGIDSKLKNAAAALSNVPGVDTALQGITNAQQENYQRLAAYQNAQQAANNLFSQMQKHYTILAQAVNALPIPEQSQGVQQLPMGNVTNQRSN